MEFFLYTHFKKVHHPNKYLNGHWNIGHGKWGRNFKSMIFELILWNSSLDTHDQIAHRCMPQNLTMEKSALVQVMA